MRNFISIKGIKDMLAKSYKEVSAKKEDVLSDTTLRELEVLKHVIFDGWTVGTRADLADWQYATVNTDTRTVAIQRYKPTKRIEAVHNPDTNSIEIVERLYDKSIHIYDVYVYDGQYFETKFGVNASAVITTNNLAPTIEKFILDDHVDTLNAPIVNALGMFMNCVKLKQIVLGHGFDSTKIINMSGMFYNCLVLDDLRLSDGFFNTGNVTNMSMMFCKCYQLQSLDLSRLDTHSVNNMQGMFNGCLALQELDVSGFDTGNVTRMDDMFSLCRYLEELDISSFDTSKVTAMNNMFCGCNSLKCIKFNPSINTQSCTTMAGMFTKCTNLTELDLSMFNTSNVRDMSMMFAGGDIGPSLEHLDISGFDTGKVTTMQGMFNSFNMKTRINVSHFDTRNVTDMSYMFAGCKNTVCVSGIDTSKVTTMGSMFNTVKNNVLDLTSFDTHNVINMSRMFSLCNSIMILVSRDKWVVRDDCNTTEMFLNCNVDHVTYIEDLNICYDENEINKWDCMWGDDSDLKPGQHGGIIILQRYHGDDPDFVIYDAYMMNGLMYIAMIDMEGGNGLIDPASYNSIETITIGRNVLIDYNNSSLLQFGNLDNLRSVNFGENITSMINMFYNSTITSIDLSQCDLSGVASMHCTFYNCKSLEQIIFPDELDLGNVTNIHQTFYGCKSLTELDLTSLNVNGATNMHAFINTCPALTEVLVSRDKWNIPDSCNSKLMFNVCGTDHFTYDDEVA